VSLLAVSLILSVDFYHQLSQTPILDDLLLYLFTPLLIILVIFHESPVSYGMTLERWREGLVWTAVGAFIMVGVAWTFLRLPEFRTFYTDYFIQRDPAGGVTFGWRAVGLSGLQLFAWEFLFRGFLLFSLVDLFGFHAVWIQTVPFAMAHFGKPEWETYASIIGGVLSGWIAYRLRSFYPSWLIHWALAVGIGLLLRAGW